MSVTDETLGVIGQQVPFAPGKRMGVGDRSAAAAVGPFRAGAALALVVATVAELFENRGIRPDLP